MIQPICSAWLVSAISEQLQEAVKKARESGTALAIGHPYRATIRVLAEQLPLLQEQGITLVSVAELINYRGQRFVANSNSVGGFPDKASRRNRATRPPSIN